jgi:MraZ protein
MECVVFTGTYKRALDSKQRVLLPKRLRLGLSKPNSDEQNLFLTPGADQCLELHTSQSLNELATRASKSPSGAKNLRSFSRLFYARAQQCDIDKQGRIRIPVELAGLANLEKEVVFVGVGFHWEIWDLDRWDEYLASNDSAFDQIADLTFDAMMPTANGSAVGAGELVGHKPK